MCIIMQVSTYYRGLSFLQHYRINVYLLNRFCTPSIHQCGHCILYVLVDGSSDDLDEPIKELFQDREFVKEHNLCSINSINWARILVQVRMEKFPCSTKWLLNTKMKVQIFPFSLILDGSLRLHIFSKRIKTIK